MALLPWLLRASRGRRGACLRPRRSTPLPLMMLCHRRAGRDISRSANNSAGVCATQSSISCVCPWRPKSRAWSSKPSKREFDFVERRTNLLVVDSAPVHLDGTPPQAPATAWRGGECRSALPPYLGLGRGRVLLQRWGARPPGRPRPAGSIAPAWESTQKWLAI